jgi:hypothetical protein
MENKAPARLKGRQGGWGQPGQEAQLKQRGRSIEGNPKSSVGLEHQHGGEKLRLEHQ